MVSYRHPCRYMHMCMYLSYPDTVPYLAKPRYRVFRQIAFSYRSAFAGEAPSFRVRAGLASPSSAR